MSRRNRRAGGPKGTALNTPFRELGKLVPKAPTAATRRPPQRSPRVETAATVDDEETLFRTALEGVTPISPEDRNQAGFAPPTANTGSPRLREETEVLWELSELVSGNGCFEVSDTDEHIEGWVLGLDPRIMQKLRAGEFACQTHLDLHGMTSEEGNVAVRQFVLRALRAGHRCVLIVHGRGRNSKDRRPVLKDALRSWLSRGELARVVLAFSSARTCDGGAGATYVLLRRDRRKKKPFATLSGKS